MVKDLLGISLKKRQSGYVRSEFQLKTIKQDGAVCAHSCPTLCDPKDHMPPGSSVHGISKARILEWVSISSSGRSPHLYLLHFLNWQADALPLHHVESPIWRQKLQSMTNIGYISISAGKDSKCINKNYVTYQEKSIT